MRVIFSLGLMINGRTRFPNINEHINEICYILTWSKHTIKFELVELIEFSSRYVTGIIIYNKFDVSLMKNQILMALGVAIVASVLVTGLTSSIYAQSNMTGGNMTGGNMTGGNMTGGNMTGGMSTDGGDNGDGDNGDGGDGSDGQDDDEGSN
jgi:hypothetical protein